MCSLWEKVEAANRADLEDGRKTFDIPREGCGIAAHVDPAFRRRGAEHVDRLRGETRARWIENGELRGQRVGECILHACLNEPRFRCAAPRLADRLCVQLNAC